MKERVLSLDLKSAVEAFTETRWEFFEGDEETKIIKIEVPRGFDESYVIELPYPSETEEKQINDSLLGAGFIEQKKRVTSNW
ncbi:MAG: hypothetical protein QG670_1935 [Thermoproteota archaeon]|nr:hypothetical protein [Thermoproteota archaeon]